MKKRVMSLLITAILTIGLITGCGNTAQSMTDTTSMAVESTSLQETSLQNATTEVTSKKEDTTKTGSDSNMGNNTNTEGTENLIGKKEAVKIALEKVKGAKESDVRIHLDTEDGVRVYEGSIVHNEIEYDFEIDAKTGAIIEWESESIYD